MLCFRFRGGWLFRILSCMRILMCIYTDSVLETHWFPSYHCCGGYIYIYMYCMYMYLYSLYTINYTVHMYIYIYAYLIIMYTYNIYTVYIYIYTYIYTVCIYVYIYIYMHLCFFMFSLGLKRILQETSHLHWENHGKCSCVSADFPEIS